MKFKVIKDKEFYQQEVEKQKKLQDFLGQTTKQVPSIRGRYINAADVSELIKRLSSFKLYGKLPEKKFSNVLYWNFADRTVRAHLYERYALIEKHVLAPEELTKDNIWILYDIIPIGSFFDEEIDELGDIQKAVRKASKKENYDWNKKFELNKLTISIAEQLQYKIPRIWFDVEQMKILSPFPDKRIISVNSKNAGGHGRLDPNKIACMTFELWIDEHNILHYFQGLIMSDNKSNLWGYSQSDLIAKFAPWQTIEHITKITTEFAYRF